MRPLRSSLFVVVAAAFVLFFISMLIFPQAALDAALKGFSIWWDVLFPALFPFLVISEIMLGFGVVHFLGTLFDPVMRPLFRVPGIGGFVFAMGFAAGYPVGSKLTTQLKEQGLIEREEAERLVAFTSTSDPIFLISAVSIGFFHDPALALVLAVAHYGTAVIIGLLMRFYRPHAPSGTAMEHREKRSPIIVRAIRAMHTARLKDGRSLGTLLQDAIQSSLQLIMVIGGLMVFFSVILTILTELHWMSVLTVLIGTVLGWFGMPHVLAEAVVNGLFEVTLGAKSAGFQASELGLLPSAAIAAFILSWSGLSVHAQIVSIMSRAQLRYAPFLAARALHGALAAVAVFLLWEWLYPAASRTMTAIGNVPVPSSGVSSWGWYAAGSSIIALSIVVGLLGLSLLFGIWNRLFKRY